MGSASRGAGGNPRGTADISRPSDGGPHASNAAPALATLRALRQDGGRPRSQKQDLSGSRKSGSQWTRRWREMDSNLYGAFPVKRLFWVVLTVFCSERERPFF